MLQKVTVNLFVVPFQARLLKSNRSDTWQQQRQQQRQHLPLTAQSFPGGKSSLCGRCERAMSFNRISQQKVRSTMSKLCTIGSGAGFDVSQSTGDTLWRFRHLPKSNLWELIKHWTALGQASAQNEKDLILLLSVILKGCYICYLLLWRVWMKDTWRSVDTNTHQLLI